MRMWMVNPKYLCWEHLVTEIDDLHELARRLRAKRSIDTDVFLSFVFPQLMYQRHRVLCNEVLTRRMPRPQSVIEHITRPLPLVENLPHVAIDDEIIKRNTIDLMQQCDDCFVRIVSGGCD